MQAHGSMNPPGSFQQNQSPIVSHVNQGAKGVPVQNYAHGHGSDLSGFQTNVPHGIPYENSQNHPNYLHAVNDIDQGKINAKNQPGFSEMEESKIKKFFTELFGKETTFETLYIYNFVTAGVHATSAFVIFILSLTIETSVARVEQCGFRNYTDTSGPYIADFCSVNNTFYNSTGFSFYTKPEEIFDRKLYYAVIITLFFILSFVFQAGQGFYKESYKFRVENNQANFVRYIEYSLSASLMMMAIAASVSVMDFYTHILVFTCTMLCMLIGLVADYVRVMEFTIRSENTPRVSQGGNNNKTSIHNNTPQDQRSNTDVTPDTLWTRCADDLFWIKWGLHALGWIAILVPFLLVFSVAWARLALRSSPCSQSADASTEGPPWWVTPLIIVEFLLFLSFGAVHKFQFASKDPLQKKVGIRTELQFITLSAISKSVLGWFLVANVLIGT